MNNIDFNAELGAPYIPVAKACSVLDVETPDSMEYEIHIAARKIKQEVGEYKEYVSRKLKYNNDEICECLSAEQIDAVALAIYNIENRNQALIVGDQTGIGKGRVAAAIIRYGIMQGKQPIFLSEKPNLFSDIYRDLVDIKSESFVPFIVNNKEAKTHIKDKEGNIVYQALPKPEQDKIIKSKKLPKNYNYIVATYSQFNQPQKKPLKPMFLSAMADNNVIIMDEAHNAAGTSNTGQYMKSIIRKSQGVVYLSATFAKRPDNMPVYSVKTCLSEANMTDESLVEAITKGGVALQEVISSQLVSQGQMIRRERSYEGIEVNYITLTEQSKKHREVSDKITNIIRGIIQFQIKYINEAVKILDGIKAGEGGETVTRKGTEKAGVDNSPYFSKVFNVINQLLFSVKSEDVAKHTIKRLKEGKKCIIAFSSTMGAFLDDMGNSGDEIDGDFATVLMKGLNSVLRYTEIEADGTRILKEFNISELGNEAVEEYNKLSRLIKTTTSGISVSPIDYLQQYIEAQGYRVAEVTGRSMYVEFAKKANGEISTIGTIMPRKKLTTNDAFRKFNDNEYDVLMINQSGSTGASAHAITTAKVPESEVKQRVMIVLQPELDINTEIQKRGRINRTGQILKPIYDYVMSDIPAEQRLMMMLKRKLKSLDANTTSNQSNSEEILKSNDFLNKYGDKIVTNYLIENPEYVDMLDDPLKFKGKNEDITVIENAAAKVSGRVAVLSTELQEKFYNDIIEQYQDYIRYLINTGEYDLEMEAMNLEARTIEKEVFIAGKGGISPFSEDTYIETIECNVLKKPYKSNEIRKLINEAVQGQSPQEIQLNIRNEHKEYLLKQVEIEREEIGIKHAKLKQDITLEAKYKKLETDKEKSTYITKRNDEIENAFKLSIQNMQARFNNKYDYLEKYFKYFYIGKPLKYPVISAAMATKYEPYAIFLGFDINKTKSNPYAPSSIKAKLAIADSTKYMVLTLSGEQGAKLTEIIGVSYDINMSTEQLLEQWDELIKENTTERTTRYVITGNILQGADIGGRLIDYTLQGGGTKKGVLLPAGFNFGDSKKIQKEKVVVPIIKALKYIKSMTQGAMLSTENAITFARTYYGYKIIMPKTSTYKPIFTNQNILALIDNPDGFNLQSGSMVANIQETVIEDFINILQNEYSLSISIPRTIFEQFINTSKDNDDNKEDKATTEAYKMYQNDKQQFEKRRNVKSNKPETAKINSNIEMLKLRLKLQKAKLELLKTV